MEIILFILFVVASVVFRILQPRIKGYLGEKSVATILSLLPSDKYKIINDLLIEVDGRTIQIDHLVVSIYGIFVIETKNYKGRITGSDNSDYWTKNMFGNKYTFYNPISFLETVRFPSFRTCKKSLQVEFCSNSSSS